jgi:hypothetical protein
MAILTRQHRLQTLLESALTSGNLSAFDGRHLTPAETAKCGWSADAYRTTGVILYAARWARVTTGARMQPVSRWGSVSIPRGRVCTSLA